MEDEKSVVMIGVASGASMSTETAKSLFSTLQFAFSFHLQLKIIKGTYIDKNRMDLVEAAREMKASHLMFVDTDMLFPPWGIEVLFSHKKMVVGGTYNFKTFALPDAKVLGPAPTVKLIGENGEPVNPEPGTLPKEMFKCYALPGGFMMVDMKVFEIISHPYFYNCWQGDRYTGEDVYFCERVREKGMDVWCDPTIPIYHIGPYLY